MQSSPSLYKHVLSDTFWQIAAKIISALIGFFVTMMITRYLGPLRYGDYGTITQYFVLRTAFADFGLYVIGLKDVGEVQEKQGKQAAAKRYTQYVRTRIAMMVLIYLIALLLAYSIPSYTQNIYLIVGLPLGMLFSALSLGGSMYRMPLQLQWKMKHVSIALFLARIAQILVLASVIYFIAPGYQASNDIPLWVFIAIVSSLVASAGTEYLYTRYVSKQFLSLQRISIQEVRGFARSFFLTHLPYGIGQFLSGLYVPLLFIVLGRLYPTSQGYTYTGQWFLASALMSMLWIVSSALGNSMLHKVSEYNLHTMKTSFGSFFHLLRWLGCLVTVNFFRFAQAIIGFIAGGRSESTGFITQSLKGEELQNIYQGIVQITNQRRNHGFIDQSLLGADIILPFFGIVLLLSFVKNMFTYLCIATKQHNKLLYINLIAVLVGGSIGYALIRKFALLGALVGQILYGVIIIGLYALYTYQQGHFPHISVSKTIRTTLFFGCIGWIGQYLTMQENDILIAILIAIPLNAGCFLIRYPRLKKTAKQLV